MFKMSCGSSKLIGPTTDTAPNPNPYKFKILEVEKLGNHCLVLASYDGCTTFNGRKLMLIEGTPNVVHLDPHFLDDKHCVKARFEPSELGYKLARAALEAAGR